MITQNVGIASALLAAALSAGMGGCVGLQPSPKLPAGSFVHYRQLTGPNAGQGVDQPGGLAVADHGPVQQVPDTPQISETVREEVKPPGPEGIGGPRNPNISRIGPATEPTATQGIRPALPPIAAGQFQWLGTVVARVDGEPIFADKVLTTLERVLATEARAGDEQRFRAIARDLVIKQVTEFIDNELEYTAARKALDKKDETIAKYATAEWRKEQVRKAGGSEARAKQRAAEEGFDFEELARQQYRINMTRLYYQTKIFPMIQIRAQDMRQFYQANIKKFQKPAAVKFRVLWISAEKTGGKEAALKKATEIYERAKRGEDFSELASKFNDEPALMHSKGVVGNESGWMEKGEFAAEKLEDAVWELHPGEVTLPTEGKRGNDGYWVARLDEIRPGRSDPFEDAKVQAVIRATLHSQQLNKLREAHQMMLQRQAVVLQTEGALEVTMEMVMQRYRVWVR